ncbi:MAG: PrsW family intramembrane metalloprotease [Candidatus Pacebacteria bacterium]|nr:PrsW family intramembrane metalloprotease [Candidatus Paceibacterota bacterium]
MSATAVLYSFLSGLLPSLIWLWFWLREDRLHPEPRPLLVFTFFGGMVAVALAIIAERWIAGIYTDPTIQYTLWAFVEEIAKFLAVAVIALRASANDEPIDAMIYCIVAAIGFAALENAFFIMDPLSSGEVARAIVSGNMRFIGATLLHIVSSASIGFMIGYVFYKGPLAKICAAVVGVIIAGSVHAAFNLSIINADSMDTLRTFAWVWGAVVILIVLFEEIKLVRPKLW